MTWVRKTIEWGLVMVLALAAQSDAKAQNYSCNAVSTWIFSSTPLEDIRAESEKGSGVIVTATRAVAVQIPVKTLEFDRKLMQEHFNENYMESDRYPYARFKGTLDPGADLSKDGTYSVNVNGVLSVHGVDKQRTIPCKLVVKNGVVNVEAQFKVACADHNITIPRLVFTKIAESISVRISGQFNALKPN